MEQSVIKRASEIACAIGFGYARLMFNRESLPTQMICDVRYNQGQPNVIIQYMYARILYNTKFWQEKIFLPKYSSPITV